MPDGAFTLFNLGWALMDLGRTQEALGGKGAVQLFRRVEVSIIARAPEWGKNRKSPISASIIRKLFHPIAVVRRHPQNQSTVCSSLTAALRSRADLAGGQSADAYWEWG